MRDWTPLLTEAEKAAFAGTDANALIEDAVKAALHQAVLVRQSEFLGKLAALPADAQQAILTAASTELDAQVAAAAVSAIAQPAPITASPAP
jgi:hypothetical protein